jgi:ParB-like chromosome segregation protein Spo0J
LNQQLVQLDPGALTPHPKNSRAHSSQQVNDLRQSIRRFGIVRPVICDEHHVVLAGHGLLEAARAEEFAEIPVLEISGLTEDQKRAYLIADNRLAEKSTWDWDLLAVELSELAGVFDLAELGFSEWNPATGVLDTNTRTGEITSDDLDTTHTCPRCNFEF